MFGTPRLTLLLVFISVSVYARVIPGIEVLLTDSTHLVAGKRVGLVTNPTGVTHDLTSDIDVLRAHPEVRLVSLFGPEHGVRGSADAGKQVSTYTDSLTGLPVYSLYGKTKIPTKEMLNDVDVLLFDIQDIGSRAYTYLYTMAYVMQAAARDSVPIIVLDRPDPLGGNLVEGPMLQPEFVSFIGLYEIPYIYGMTIGELAKLFNSEFNIGADLTVVPMQGWTRDMTYAETGLPWVPTSPHIPRAETPFFTATTGCMGELGTVNGGVGYTLPFELVGMPWIDGRTLADTLNSYQLPGVIFRPLYYTPYYTGLKGKELQGVQIHIVDQKAYRPMLTQLHILYALYTLYPEHDIFASERTDMFDKAMGTDEVRKSIVSGVSADTLYNRTTRGLNPFLHIRSQYLIYKD